MTRQFALAFALALSLVTAPLAVAQTPRRLTDLNANAVAVGRLGDRSVFLNLGASGSPGMVSADVWTSDGTPGGTRLVKALEVPVDASVVAEPTAAGSSLFFLVYGNDRQDLLVTDGTAQGTRILDGGPFFMHCPNGALGRPILGALTSFEERLFYWRAGEIWSADNTSARHELDFTNLCGFPGLFALQNDLLALRDPDAGQVTHFGPEVWRIDGTPGGTRLVLGGRGTNASEFVRLGDRFFFTARDMAGAGTQRRLWSSDGGPAVLVATADEQGILDPVVSGNRIFFTVGDSELWVTNGMPGQASRVLERPGIAYKYFDVGGRLFFIVGSEVWVTDGAPGHERLVANLSDISNLQGWDDRLLITAGAGPDRQLWLIDANDTLTLLGNLGAVAATPPVSASFAGKFYYACQTGAAGTELCRTDGTAAGTSLIDIRPGAQSSNPGGLRALPHRLVFVADDAVAGRELWTLGNDTVVSVADANVTEPLIGTATATFTVSVDPPSTAPVTVAFQTAEGTAKAGQDYDAKSGTLTFAPGVVTQTVDVTVRRDNRDGPTSLFYLDLSNPVGAVILRGRAVGTIEDVDPAPTLTPGDGVILEGTGAASMAAVTLTLSAPSEYTVSVSWTTMDGDAQAGSDYAASGGSVSFPAGSTQMMVNVPVTSDSLDESNEAFLVLLSNETYATLARTMAQATILDDDGRIATCLPIAYVPYIISAQGRYCLSRNVSTAATTGAAISIESDFVDLDLRGFKIGGGAAGLATLTDGVRAVGRRNITVRSGNIRGFYRGVAILGASNAARVENVRLDENTLAAIVTEGTGHTIRRNSIVATGGTTTTANADTFGIQATGPGVRILNNDVTDTAPVGTGEGLAISASAAGGAVIEGNRVGLGAAAPNTVGIGIGSGADVLAARNRIVRTQSGIRFSGGATGHYRDNLTAGVTNPYTGGTDAGGNN